MNKFKSFFMRLYQKILYISSYFLSFKEPIIIKGTNSFNFLSNLIKNYNKNKVLLVTDEGLHKLGLDKQIYSVFENENIDYTLYYHVTSNPTIQEVELGVLTYNSEHCDCIVVIGGGSAIDAAKVIAARVSNPKMSIEKMKGLLKIRKKLPLLIAIPTTAGTGSEATVAAVISNPNTKEKFTIEDTKLIPSYAILNPNLLVNLPASITATTGMDALTHAIEAYIGKSNTKKTKTFAIEAMQLIHKYLYISYLEPENLLAREKMQLASYDAGVAFTRAYVGYVHAIAHTLGGFYKIPHGLANAVILPIVLEEYGNSVVSKLSEIYDVIYLSDTSSNEVKAKTIIDNIYKLNEKMNIPTNFKGIILDEDIPTMVKRAMKEANPLYPVPEIWGEEKFIKIFKRLQAKED